MAPDRARLAARYHGPRPTSADAPALVRRRLWRQEAIRTPARGGGTVEAPRAVLERLTEALCDAA